MHEEYAVLYLLMILLLASLLIAFVIRAGWGFSLPSLLLLVLILWMMFGH